MKYDVSHGNGLYIYIYIKINIFKRMSKRINGGGFVDRSGREFEIDMILRFRTGLSVQADSFSA
jgi:hypothetical protein